MALYWDAFENPDEIKKKYRELQKEDMSSDLGRVLQQYNAGSTNVPLADMYGVKARDNVQNSLEFYKPTDFFSYQASNGFSYADNETGGAFVFGLFETQRFKQALIDSVAEDILNGTYFNSRLLDAIVESDKD